MAFLVVLDPGYHNDVHRHGVVCAGEVGRVAVAAAGGGGGLMKAVVVGAATAAGVGIVVEPDGQPAAAPAEHMRASRDQNVQTPVVPVGIHRKA